MNYLIFLYNDELASKLGTIQKKYKDPSLDIGWYEDGNGSQQCLFLKLGKDMAIDKEFLDCLFSYQPNNYHVYDISVINQRSLRMHFRSKYNKLTEPWETI